MNKNLYILITLCFIVSSLWLVSLVFINKRKGDVLSRLLTLLFLAGLLWGIGSLQFALVSSEAAALYWWRFAHVGAIAAPVFFAHLILKYVKQDHPIVIRAAYGFMAFVILVNIFSGNHYIAAVHSIFDGIYWHDWQRYHVPLFIVNYLLIYCALLPYSFFQGIIYLRHAPDKTKIRLKYLLIGAGIGWVGPHLFFLLDFGFSIYPFSNLILTIFILITWYAIQRHQLLEITIVIRRGLIYSILVSTLTIIYFISVLFWERITQQVIGYNSKTGSFLAAIIISICFIPFRNKIQILIDNLFYKNSTAEIFEQNELLKQEITKKDKFKTVAILASNIAHEIKNPITTIKTFFEYIPNKKNDPEFLEKLNRIAGQEIDRINELIQQLLEFSKPSPPIFKEVLIQKLISETLSFIGPQLRKHNIKLVTQFESSNNITLQLDPNKIKQALLNILLNAVDAMPQGGTLTVSTHLQPPGHITLAIQDTGCGIDKRDLPHIFDPFFSKKEGGTGLGLAISKGIVEEHKGQIKAESQAQKGTTFTIALAK